MAAIISRIRALNGAGIFANHSAREAPIEFRKYNLIYGFNGSGKSTLTRIFSCLQDGQKNGSLPDNCSFEIEMSDGTVFSTPDELSGLERRLSVFNADFVDRNLQWSQGKAHSVFYLSEEQADAAAKLAECEAGIVTAKARAETAKKIFEQTERSFIALKRDRARLISQKFALGRQYEAPQLVQDYALFADEDFQVLSEEELAAYDRALGRSDPPPKIKEVQIGSQDALDLVRASHTALTADVSTTILSELNSHPQMVAWVRQGHEYHQEHSIENCLHCGNSISATRVRELAEAFESGLSKLIDDIRQIRDKALESLQEVTAALNSPLSAEQFLHTKGPPIEESLEAFRADLKLLEKVLNELVDFSNMKLASPTSKLNFVLPTEDQVFQLHQRIETQVEIVNSIIRAHNLEVTKFSAYKQAAMAAIKSKMLADGFSEYQQLSDALSAAITELKDSSEQLQELTGEASDLRNLVRTNGPAADLINDLVAKYLGHSELSIAAVDDGYELLRHGKIVSGQPSEGEKTAIALCYFLTTLEADGRKPQDQIIVVDDPISSLDTKAMNYACAMLKRRMKEVSQVILLTHNQHCMNEFKKHWKSSAYPKNPNTTATARLLFLDVRIPEGSNLRTSKIVELSPLLREYDSEYHFLCHKVLEFEKAGSNYSDIGYLMPHILRRVVELFLSFKIPGTDSISGKLDAIYREYPSLNKARLDALERLSQVESHTDAIEDAVHHSSMTIEEARDANSALLELMTVTDPLHTRSIRKQCAPG